MLGRALGYDTLFYSASFLRPDELHELPDQRLNNAAAELVDLRRPNWASKPNSETSNAWAHAGVSARATAWVEDARRRGTLSLRDPLAPASRPSQPCRFNLAHQLACDGHVSWTFRDITPAHLGCRIPGPEPALPSPPSSPQSPSSPSALPPFASPPLPLEPPRSSASPSPTAPLGPLSSACQSPISHLPAPMQPVVSVLPSAPPLIRPELSVLPTYASLGILTSSLCVCCFWILWLCHGRRSHGAEFQRVQALPEAAEDIAASTPLPEQLLPGRKCAPAQKARRSERKNAKKSSARRCQATVNPQEQGHVHVAQPNATLKPVSQPLALPVGTGTDSPERELHVAKRNAPKSRIEKLNTSARGTSCVYLNVQARPETPVCSQASALGLLELD